MVRCYPLHHLWREFWTGMLWIEGPDSSVLVDSALRDAPEATVEPFLREHHLSWNHLHWIVHTHAHGDHMEGDEAIRRLSGAKIAIHRAGEKWLRDQGVAPDLLLEHEEVRNFDSIALKIIPSPGHSPDSICVLEPDSGTLFTGDSVQGLGSPNIGVALYQDPVAYRKTLEKLRAMRADGEIRRLCCGHPELPCSGDLEGAEIDRFLTVSLEVIDRYAEAVDLFLQTHEDASVEELQKALLRSCGTTQTPAWAELSLGMAATLRKIHG